MVKALITGISGQDGSYLSELLLSKGYEVHGIIRRQSVYENQQTRIFHILDKINLHYGDVTDYSSINKILEKVKPNEVYNLAAQSHVRISSDVPCFTAQTNAIGALNVLEAFKNNTPNGKFYQAGSSEQFGNNIELDGFQRETTYMNPVSPYGITKLFAHNMCRHYRKAYNLFVCNGILFNHESPRRGTNFVTGKVVKGAVEIKKGVNSFLSLGNLDTYRDWGHSKDYVEAMWLMLQQQEPNDFVISSMVTHSVKDLVEYVFNKLDLDWKLYIKQDQVLMRPEELIYLKGDSSKARNILGWKPKYNFHSLLDEMINDWMVRI